MRLLFLGGTRFVGAHMVEFALDRGHEVTTFTRGKTNPDLFEEVVSLQGDRDEGDYEALEDGEWDAVIDTSAYFPRAVHQALDALDGSFDHYTLISTTSVYRDFDGPRVDERYPLESTEGIAGNDANEAYGPLKVMCEQAIEERLGADALIVRPGIVAGPRDPTDRFTYWPVRVREGGRVLAPYGPEEPLQYIDARDLGAWIVSAVPEGLSGTFNAVTPPGEYTFGEFLETSRRITDSDADLEWVSADFLSEHTTAEDWNVPPMWAAPDEPDYDCFYRVRDDKAREAGLECRPIAETIRDTLDWFDGSGRELAVGFDRAFEQRLLEKWSES